MGSNARKMQRDRFYVLNGQVGLSATAHGAAGSRYGDYPKCDLCAKAIGMREWLPPYRAELDVRGREYPDLVVFSSDWLLVSDRFSRLWQKSDLAGLSGFEPVEIVVAPDRCKQRRGRLPQYVKVELARSNAAIDQEVSGFGWSPPSPVFCNACRSPLGGEMIKRWARLVLEPNTWSGEDVFIPRGVNQVIVTQRFKKLCEASAVKNAFFIRADQYAYDFYPWERENWEAQLFDETLAVLRERNTEGRFDKVLEIMKAIRGSVVAQRRNDWVKDVDERCAGSGNDVSNAAGTAYRRLTHKP
jgi:hypothetical protein